MYNAEGGPCNGEGHPSLKVFVVGKSNTRKRRASIMRVVQVKIHMTAVNPIKDLLQHDSS